jgi:hypothetical protein
MRQRSFGNWDWRAILQRRVDRALYLYPKEVNLFLGVLAGLDFVALPTTQEQQRYVTELMRARGYGFVKSQPFLWIGRQLTYRRNDAQD